MGAAAGAAQAYISTRERQLTLLLFPSRQPDATRRDYESQKLGVGYSSSDDGYSSKGHGRRPSNALSFTSTIPEGTTARASPSDLEAGLVDGAEDDEPKKGKILGFIPRRQKKEIVPFKFPDPSPDQMGPFNRALLPSVLYNMFDPKSYQHLAAIGGTQTVLEGLKTNPKTGLSDNGDDFDERVRIYGANRVPQKKSKSFLALCWAAYTVSIASASLPTPDADSSLFLSPRRTRSSSSSRSPPSSRSLSESTLRSALSLTNTRLLAAPETFALSLRCAISVFFAHELGADFSSTDRSNGSRESPSLSPSSSSSWSDPSTIGRRSVSSRS